MKHTTEIEVGSGRKFYLDAAEGEGELTFLLNLHGGGSAGAWQRHCSSRRSTSCRQTLAGDRDALRGHQGADAWLGRRGR